MVAEPVAQRETVVYELSVDALFGFGGKADQGGGGCQKASSGRHLFSVAITSAEAEAAS